MRIRLVLLAMLLLLANLLTVNLGPAMPFHPLIGNHEAVGPDAVERFARHFKIKNRAPLDSSHLAYAVDVGPVHVVMLATDYYSKGMGGVVEHTLSDQEMAWLSSDLQAHQKSAVRLVMGHEPAYSVFKTGAGLDRHPAVRDRFWATLQANRVDAYVCSHEHLHDRRRVGGVWQVISGGGGAPLMKKAGGQAYYHFLLITLGGAQPRVEVIDINGKVRDTFTL